LLLVRQFIRQPDYVAALGSLASHGILPTR
jgi:hypothetical protein